MKIKWSHSGSRDVIRLHAYLAQVAPESAAKVTQMLTRAPNRLRDFPRVGERVESEDTVEIRRLSVGHYVMHFEITGDEIVILRVWHAREERR